MITRNVVRSSTKQKKEKEKEKKVSKKSIYTFINIKKIVVRSSSLSVTVTETMRDDVCMVDYVEIERENLDKVADNKIFTDNGTLYFKQGDVSGISVLSVHGEVALEVPFGFAMEYELASATGDITLNAPTIGETKLSNVSGKIRVKQGGDSLSVSTAGGSVKIEAPFLYQNINSVSGKISTLCDAKSELLTAKSINSNIKIAIPVGADCDFDYNTLSGNIEMEQVIQDNQKEKKRFNQPLKIIASTICGSIKVLENIY